MNRAPVYVQAFDLAVWLVKNVPGSGPVADAVHRDGIALLDQIVLALKGVDLGRHLDAADARNALLRVHVRLAHEVGLVDERQLLYLSHELDEIGRQVGGWLLSLEDVSPDARHR